MTNAEKLAKDAELIADIIDISKFCDKMDSCEKCPLFISKDCLRDRFLLKEWIESEVEEDAEIH